MPPLLPGQVPNPAVPVPGALPYQIPGMPQPGPGNGLPPLGPQAPQQPSVPAGTPGRPPASPYQIPGAPTPGATGPGLPPSPGPFPTPNIPPHGPGPRPMPDPRPGGGGPGSPQLPPPTHLPPVIYPNPAPASVPGPPQGAPIPGFPNPVYGDDERRRRYFDSGGVAPVAGPVTMTRVPTAAEIEFLPAGQDVETPIGTLRKDPSTGRAGLALNASGQAAYQRAAATAKQTFLAAGSHPFASDPSAPQPEVIPGKPNYNPFSNTWT